MRQVPKLSCHIIPTVRDFSNNHYFYFYREYKQDNKFDHAFRIHGKLKTKRKKKGINPRRKRQVKKYEQTVSADLEEGEIVVVIREP